ncbi:hypothetical protein T310_10008 [Rasamsonia emersonii CBS 393.64]|uniref:Sulfite reductase beta subunit n=1 Tax=Rasamsonia emersonii (strain ATCC 16479 / CBS 393.64 / IMI 116815) TaxID=1408163 RepID=A0A0F4YEN2_RASE3|nr:hypothetical protein T310_10008 [Rasamsonia emersonii CBS 393.64]KKA16401.1 hypothetical protein T310_10008 [Rasamsonia emersonii CBS 393.64]
MASSDPIVASYDVYLTDSQISRYVLQYVDRPTGHAYDERNGQKPTVFRLKPKTGLVEVDVPINTQVNYDVSKGLKYGEALKRSRATNQGGAYGLAGGFNSSSGAARVKVEDEDVDMVDDEKTGKPQAKSLLKVQTLGGMIKNPQDGDPLYMLGAFRGKPARAKRDGDEEAAPRDAEARVIDVKVKSAEGGEAIVAGNIELLKKMQDEKWESYEWVDAETEEAWFTYENYMIHNNPEELPQLQSAIDGEDYLDEMSAPRVDPAHPELTGWAMKQNRKKQKRATAEAGEG